MLRTTSADLPSLVSDRGHVSDSITTKDGGTANEDDSDDDFEGFEDDESEEVEGNGAAEDQTNASDRAAQVKEWIRQSRDETNKGKKWKDKAFNIAAPLPLLSFKAETSEVAKAITITGETCISVLNKIPELSFMKPKNDNGSVQNGIPQSSSKKSAYEVDVEDSTGQFNDQKGSQNSGEKLQDPRHAMRLNRFFTVRSERELLVRQSDFMKDQQHSLASKLENNSANEKGEDNDDDTVVSETPVGNVNRKKTLAESLGAVGEMPRLVDFLIFDERSNENIDGGNEIKEKHQQASYEANLHYSDSNSDHTLSNSTTSRSQSNGADRVMSPIKTDRDDALSSASNLVVPCQCFDASSLQAAQGQTDSNGKEKDVNASNGSTECLYCKKRKSCTFDSNFECGNLQKVVRTEGREKLMPKKVIDNLNSSLPGNANLGVEASGLSVQPSNVDHEYNLWCRKDLNTGGNIQWYYFSVTSPPDQSHVGSKHGVSYPLTVRFNIVNMMKNDALYNYGMRPAVLSLHDKQKDGSDWAHKGHDICYYKNSLTSLNVDNLGSSLPQVENNSLGISSSLNNNGKGKKKVKQFYTLTFTYTFTGPDTVYFAHCFPYSYSDLQYYLRDLERDERISQIMTRRVLCYTIAGNRCDLLTITGRSQDKEEVSKRPAIVFSARIHPGETNSSYAMHGFLQFILDDTPEAIALRNTFVFKIVPMLNPDGVIHGNYRCSLAATDLNRRFGNCNMYLHPTVYNLNRMLCHLQDTRGVLLYLDIHGHSKNKNAFFYGCDIVQQPEHWLRQDVANKTRMEILAQRVYCRIFPMILCSLSVPSGKDKDSGGNDSTDKPSPGYFCYDDNKFAVSKSKKGTGRVVAWREIGIEGAYTIELSFCGVGNNKEGSILKKAEQKRYEAFLSKNRSKLKKYIREANKERADKVGKIYSSKANTSNSVSAAHSGSMTSSVSSQGEVAMMFSHCDFSFEDILVYENLVNSYKTAKHFSKKDMLFVGHDIGLALVHFANLPMAYKFKAARTQDAQRFHTTDTSSNGIHTKESMQSRVNTIQGIIGGNSTSESLEEQFNVHISEVSMASPRRQEEESLMASVDAAEHIDAESGVSRDQRHMGNVMFNSESEDSLVSLDNGDDDRLVRDEMETDNDNTNTRANITKVPYMESGESGESDSEALTARSTAHTARTILTIDESDTACSDDNSDLVLDTGRDSLVTEIVRENTGGGLIGSDAGESIATNYSAFDVVTNVDPSNETGNTNVAMNDNNTNSSAAFCSTKTLKQSATSQERNSRESSHIPSDLLQRLSTSLQYPELDDLFYKSNCLKKPLIEASPFCSDAITFAQRRYPDDFFTKIGSDNNQNIGMRVKVELAVTRQLGYILINPSSIDRGMMGRRADVDDESQDSRNSSVGPSPVTIEAHENGNHTDNTDKGRTTSPLAPSDMNNDNDKSVNKKEEENPDNTPMDSLGNERNSSAQDLKSKEGTPKSSPRITNKKRLSRKETLRRKTSNKSSSNDKNNSTNSSKNSFPKLDFDMEEFTQAGQKALEEEGESDGSDSEPSVDNVPTEDMLKTLKVKKGGSNLKKSDRAGGENKRMSIEHIANTLRAAEIKLRQKELLASKQQAIAEKQRMAQLQKLALKKMHEEKLLRESKKLSTGTPTALYLQKGTSSSSARVKAQLFTVQVPNNRRKKVNKYSPYVPNYKLSGSPTNQPLSPSTVPSLYSNIQEVLFNHYNGSSGGSTSSSSSASSDNISTSISLSNFSTRNSAMSRNTTKVLRPTSAHIQMSSDPTLALVDQMNQMNALNSQRQFNGGKSAKGSRRSNTKPSGAGSVDVDETILLMGLPDEIQARVVSRVNKSSSTTSRQGNKKSGGEEKVKEDMRDMGIAAMGSSNTAKRNEHTAYRKEKKISFVGDGSSEKGNTKGTEKEGSTRGSKDLVLPASRENHTFEIRSPVQTARKRSDSGNDNSMYEDNERFKGASNRKDGGDISHNQVAGDTTPSRNSMRLINRQGSRDEGFDQSQPAESAWAQGYDAFEGQDTTLYTYGDVTSNWGNDKSSDNKKDRSSDTGQAGRPRGFLSPTANDKRGGGTTSSASAAKVGSSTKSVGTSSSFKNRNKSKKTVV